MNLLYRLILKSHITTPRKIVNFICYRKTATSIADGCWHNEVFPVVEKRMTGTCKKVLLVGAGAG
jgi:hypothetical protein